MVLVFTIGMISYQKGIDARKAVKKWKPILETLKITDEEKATKIAVYAEQHLKLDTNNYDSLAIIEGSSFHQSPRRHSEQNLLPISIKVLSKLNNFEIVDDISLVENYKLSASVSREEVNGLVLPLDHYGLDIISRIENVLVEELVSACRNKKVLVYLMVNGLSLVTNETLTMAHQVILSSKIKIIN